MEELTLKQYRRMVDEVIEFRNLNGKMPKYAVVDGCKISRKDYLNMIETVNKFLLETGRNPGIVKIGSTPEKGYNNCEKLIIR
ncbi:pseudomurein-binding repeat-containing protein [Methanobacterium aggregans]|uniref:pseudomurein-binding repeat-containing protein n=1 Tax=Methanobacterium aggregans TaxID=1615586 RepID=UPI001AE20AAA|nr:pseudomurein-binding repeat-containing protein [Methanobacterium aggregans]MBP2045070.1 hypothetical protein [Methanobacterium aggregans]